MTELCCLRHSGLPNTPAFSTGRWWHSSANNTKNQAVSAVSHQYLVCILKKTSFGFGAERSSSNKRGFGEPLVPAFDHCFVREVRPRNHHGRIVWLEALRPLGNSGNFHRQMVLLLMNYIRSPAPLAISHIITYTTWTTHFTGLFLGLKSQSAGRELWWGPSSSCP